jgi:hypothetical protein
MKKRFITMVAAMMLLVAGCGSTSEERIAVLKSGIDKATALSAESEKYVAILDTQLTEADRMLADPAIDAELTAKIQGVIAKVQAERDKAMAQKATIDAAVENWKKQVDSITAGGSANIGTELQIIGTGITTAAPIAPGPAAGYMYLVGALLTAFGAGVGKVYQTKKDSPAIQALPEVIKGVNDILSQVTTTPDAVNQAKALLMLRQSAQTQAIVSGIKKQ